MKQSKASDKPELIEIAEPAQPRVALLTGGGDKHYSHGLASALTATGVFVDFIGSDELVSETLESDPHVNFLNLRGKQDHDATLPEKARRLSLYYLRLLWFGATAKAGVFHILWNNKLELIDRTLLICYYKLFGRRVVLTAHNVNAGRRDAADSWLNRLTLSVQYRLVDHIFAHTNKSRSELETDFGVSASKITVIPYGMNSVVPDTSLTPKDARQHLGIESSALTVLFFGQIAPYKGLEDLLTALLELETESDQYRLIIAGKPKWNDAYWQKMKHLITGAGLASKIVARIEFIPDEEVEVFFKAADVLILPYKEIFQSGVLFLSYSFGLPVIATDVGSLKEDVLDGETGFMCRANDPSDLAAKIRQHFASSLFRDLERHRPLIKKWAEDRHSWSDVATATKAVYTELAS